MRVIDASKTGILVLGYQGESQRVMVRLPLVDERNGRNVAEEFPGGQFSLSVTFPNRPGEYIVSPSDYQVTGNWIEWEVKAAYTQFFGEGNLQINYSGFDSTGMTKSRVWRITNKKSISTGAGTVPDWSDWKTELLNAAAAVQNAVDSYDEMTAEAEDGDQTSAHIDRTGDHPVLHIEIKNNGGGGGGADIDDDHTRTDKTWSSKKISDELDTKADEEDLSSLSETIVQLTGAVDDLSKDSTGIADFDISDENGNVLARFKDGEVKTKNFDSSLMKMKESVKTGTDFDLTDPDGNVLMRLKNGGIQTKCFDSNDFAPNAKVITVKTDGSGDFTSLRAAVDSITDASKDNPYRIDIYPGTYDILDEYTDAEIREADVEHYTQGFPGLLLTDGISLRGVGDRSRIIIHGELETTYSTRIRYNISTLNLQGNVNLENLTISGKNIRYCVHDDFPYVGRYKRIVRNCDFIGVSLCTDPATTYGAGGWSDGCDAIFEDCDFGTDFGMHKNEAGDTLTVFKGCRGRKLNIGSVDVHSIHRFCLIDSTFEMVNDYSNITPLEITAYGCCENIMAATDHVVITGAVTKIKLTDIPVGTMVTSNGKAITATTNKDIAFGVVIDHDSLWTYIQRTGHIYAGMLSLTGLSVGDYVTVNGSGLIVTGGTSSNAVGVCDYISDDADAGDDGKAFIKLL